jgi:hypothetical protein
LRGSIREKRVVPAYQEYFFDFFSNIFPYFFT